MTGDPRLLKAILHRATAQYLKVSPDGLHLSGKVMKSAVVRIIGFGTARTLYRDKKPTCRSLDGVVSITHVGRRCEECTFNKECTAQVRLDILASGAPYRLLLAFTSAKNFLIYETMLRETKTKIEVLEHRIEVINRGSFGELRFSRPV